MKKIYTLLFALTFLFCGKSFSQTFTYTPTDTIEYGAIGSELLCTATLLNNTATAISMRVTREQNVMGDAPNWTSAFCMKVCYFDATDSVNFTFNAMDTVNFLLHIKTVNETNPDSATVVMKWKNVNNTSNTFFQRFYGITQNGFSVNELSNHSAEAHIYPMPVVSGEVFTLGVSNVKSQKAISLVVHNMFGEIVSTSNVIAGINFMILNLPFGVYSYSLITENVVINSGKIVMAE